MSFASPKDENSYSLVLGSTFTTNAQQYHTLQYNFKPASIDSKTSGILRKSENGGLEVEMMSKAKNGANERILFKGNYAPCKEIECILIFDKVNSCFRLERLSGSGKNLKAVRTQEKRGVSQEAEAYAEYDGDGEPISGNVTTNTSQEAEEQSAIPAKKRKSSRNTADSSKAIPELGKDSMSHGLTHGPDESLEGLPDDMSDEYEHENDDIEVSMMDLLNQIESNTESISDATLELDEDMLVQPESTQQSDDIKFTNGTSEQVHEQAQTKVRGEGGSSGEESDSDSESYQSSSASDGDGSSSESE